MQVEGITWLAVTLDEEQFAAMKRLAVEVLGLTSLVEQEGWTLFAMANGTILDLYAPDAVPAYGFNNGMVFGFRVDDIEAASAELAAAGCELLGEITRIENMKYAYRHFKAPDGRVYGINEQQ
jgi:predicted enzyme related to lactoylglutathione lyase